MANVAMEKYKRQWRTKVEIVVLYLCCGSHTKEKAEKMPPIEKEMRRGSFVAICAGNVSRLRCLFCFYSASSSVADIFSSLGKTKVLGLLGRDLASQEQARNEFISSVPRPEEMNVFLARQAFFLYRISV